MIYFLVTYLLFEMGFDHWGGPGDLSKAVYFSFQYGWVAGLALYRIPDGRKTMHILIAALFAGLSLDEWISYSTGYPATTDSPVFNFTIFTGVIFVIYEILTRWKKRHSSLRGRI